MNYRCAKKELSFNDVDSKPLAVSRMIFWAWIRIMNQVRERELVFCLLNTGNVLLHNIKKKNSKLFSNN
jgi:hypothetical protein